MLSLQHWNLCWSVLLRISPSRPAILAGIKPTTFRLQVRHSTNWTIHFTWCLFKPLVTAMACKRPRSFCQKCSWQRSNMAPKRPRSFCQKCSWQTSNLCWSVLLQDFTLWTSMLSLQHRWKMSEQSSSSVSDQGAMSRAVHPLQSGHSTTEC